MKARYSKLYIYPAVIGLVLINNTESSEKLNISVF